jgi:hypothetical protein
MVYSNSCEEHKYLAGIRREEAFERLIKERGVCAVGFFYPFVVVADNIDDKFFLSRCSLL